MKIQQFDYSVDLLRALLWQYNDAAAIQSLLTQKQEWWTENQTAFWENWYNDVFNLQTANDFGLAVWSFILNLPLFINILPITPKISWGFGQYRKNFNNGNFARTQGGIVLTTEQKRLVLRLRYFQLITRGAAPEVNAFLKIVFVDYGDVYMLDGLDMSITYVFMFDPPSALLQALTDYDLLPRPAGVKLKTFFANRKTWGFGQYRKNFNNGNFNPSA